MFVTTSKKQKGSDFVQEMENKYNSIEELEKLFDETNNMKMLVDLNNWKYFKNHLDEEIETSKSIFLQNH